MTKLIKFQGRLFNPDHIEEIAPEIKSDYRWPNNEDIFYYFSVYFSSWNEEGNDRFCFKTKNEAEKGLKLLLSAFDVIKLN